MARSPRTATLALAGLALALSWANPGAAAELRFGYQVGASQSVGTTISDNEELVLLPGEVPPGGAPVATSSDTVTRLAGIQLTTGALLNLTFDVLTPTLDHSLLIGGSFSQLIPTAVPDDAAINLDDQLNIIEGNARYLARLVRPRYGVAFGGRYDVTSNGRVCTARDGAIDVNCGGTTANDQGNRFVVNGLVHRLSAESQLQLTRLAWDLDLAALYTYTINGAFTLAPGGVQNPGAVGAGTNLGGFVRLTAHEIQPTVSYRHRAGRRGLVTLRASSLYTIPVRDDAPLEEGQLAPVVQVPETLTNDANAEYLHTFDEDTSMGLNARALYSFRVPSDPLTQRPLGGATLSADTLITEARASYSERLPWELRMRLSAGAAQPWLFQPPLGAFAPPGAEFRTIRGDWTPVFDASLARTFTPVDVNLNVGRAIGPGALGVSAIINESAALVLTYQPRVFGRVAALTAGANVNQTRGVGAELFSGADAVTCDLTALPPGAECPLNGVQLAFNNRGIGANLGLGVPVFTRGQFTSILTAGYNFAWVDPDPDGVIPRRDGTLGRVPFTTHTAIVTLQLLFGRGTLQRENVGNVATAALDPFSVDARNGRALGSSRLLRRDAPLLDGTSGARPGQPAPERRDSEQAYEESRRQQAIEREARERSGIVQSSGSIQEEERRAQQRDAEERRERKEKRTRNFSEWPIGDLLPPKSSAQPRTAPAPKPPPAEAPAPELDFGPEPEEEVAPETPKRSKKRRKAVDGDEGSGSRRRRR